VPDSRFNVPLRPVLNSKRAHSFFADDLLDVLQKRCAIDNRRSRILDDPLPTDHPFRIDEEERSIGYHRLIVEHPVATNNLSLRKIAEKRIWKLQRLGKSLLRKRIVSADTEVLDI
jgi:hypothetical protein